MLWATDSNQEAGTKNWVFARCLPDLVCELPSEGPVLKSLQSSSLLLLMQKDSAPKSFPLEPDTD
jgi:hypothetical protein